MIKPSLGVCTSVYFYVNYSVLRKLYDHLQDNKSLKFCFILKKKKQEFPEKWILRSANRPIMFVFQDIHFLPPSALIIICVLF